MLGITFILLGDFGLIEGFCTPTRVVEREFLKVLEHLDLRADWTRFNQAGRDGDVITCKRFTVFKRPNSMPNV